MSLHHNDDPSCPMCEEKLKTAQSELADWFRAKKAQIPSLHISWAWRGEADQNQCYADKKTMLKWPKSPHNYMEDGKPCSLALDLFVLSEDHTAQFPPLVYARLNAENDNAGLPIVWGGKFKHLGDGDHFQIVHAPGDSAA